MNDKAYFNIKTYCDDLTERLRLVEEWKLRHPDWDTQPFRRDESDWYRAKDDEELTFKSSFDPNDLRPHTSDLLTSERWNDLMLVALTAFEKIERFQSIQGSYPLRPEDTLVINVPLDLPSEVCKELAENVPGHLKNRVVVVRSGRS